MWLLSTYYWSKPKMSFPLYSPPTSTGADKKDEKIFKTDFKVDLLIYFSLCFSNRRYLKEKKNKSELE